MWDKYLRFSDTANTGHPEELVLIKLFSFLHFSSQTLLQLSVFTMLLSG